MQLEPLSSEQFARRVYLFDPAGSYLSGAAAVFASLRSTRLRFLERWYSKSNTFATLSEKSYAFVARHRHLFSKLLSPFLPQNS